MIGSWQEHTLFLATDLEEKTWAAFRLLWENGPSERREIDFGDADVTDGPALAKLVRLLADWLDTQQLALHNPPQLVVHNLYRIGRYPHPRLQAYGIREDQAYG